MRILRVQTVEPIYPTDHPGSMFPARFGFKIIPVACVAIAMLWLASAGPALGQGNEAGQPDPAVLIEWAGKVEISRRGSPIWDEARTNAVLEPGQDLVRTGPRSRAGIRLSDRTIIRLESDTVFRVPPTEGPNRAMQLLKGLLHLFHRDDPGSFPVETPSAYAGVVGTEFVIEVAENDATTLWMLDGEVTMTNAFGRLDLRGLQGGKAEPGRAPERTAAFEAINVVQWVLYYPGLLHVEELGLSAIEREALGDSLNAYRAGDLTGALESYPADRQPSTPAETVYLAALVLAVGQVDEAEGWLAALDASEAEENRPRRLATALRRVMAAVQARPDPVQFVPDTAELATEWLAESYVRQSRNELEEALIAAKKAAELAPDFGYAWERVAELEFSFGRVGRSSAALERAMDLAPHNAQALALQGFLLAARNRTQEAIEVFDRAIAQDSALANGWLGRGLCRIQRGDVEGGQADILVAATVEPRRAVLRSYLGKAFEASGDPVRARRELDLAKDLDVKDPTAWLYSALLRQRENEIIPAIRDLEQSQALNDHRAVYRSRLLLDQDEAVRGANLANVYRDAHMTEVSMREAVRAVNADYANYSAHLFLANSYDSLRDPNQVDLRYETPWLSEYLVANLLAPVGAGTLSQSVSQQEYSKLFERNRLGVVFNSEYLSRGDWTLSGAQYGIYEDMGYAVDVFYRSRHGQRVNDEQELLTVSLQAKQQITSRDTFYAQGIYYDAESGDLAQYYDPDDANPGLSVDESQEPIALLGYRHEWGPGSHTLFLAGRMEDTLEVKNPEQDTLVVSRSPFTVGMINGAVPFTVDQKYRNELELYSTEAQQILQRGSHTWIAGGRYQNGEYETDNQHPSQGGGLVLLPQPEVSSDFERANAYFYWHWRALEPLLLVGGVAYDWIEYPRNFRFAPIASGEETEDQVSPKGGIIWTPHSLTTVRAGYAQSLGGVSFDQSFQLEPTQVAGFNQAWRSLIPESVAGANSAATFENWGVSLEQKFHTGTYVGATVEWLQSEVDREVGVYDAVSLFPIPMAAPDTTSERLDYEERALVLTLDQILDDVWSVGVRYRLSRAELEDDFVEISPGVVPVGSNFRPQQDLESIGHQVHFHVLANHPSGIFGLAEAAWYQQSNRGYDPDRPGDDFWQFNGLVGYRFLQRRMEVRVGVLNITDQDYRWNPLNLTTELPRDRTAVANFRFHF